MNVFKETRNLVTMAVLAAISIVLVYFIHFPLFAAAPFLEYDPADMPIIMSALLFGPTAGFIVTVITSIIQGLTVSANSGPIGILMHIAATGSFVLVAGNIYKRNKTYKNMIIALLSGTLSMTVVMVFWNLIVIPFYMGVPVESVAVMILPVFVPFNLIKAGVNSVVVFILYKYLSKTDLFL